MARKSEEPVALERSTQKPRRRRWWIIPLIVVGLVVIGGLLWINQIGIRRWLGDTFTAATPLPTAGASEAGVFYETYFNAPEAAADWEIFDDGTISSKVEDGRLVVGVHAFTHTGTWSGLNLSFESFVLDVEATKLDGPDDNGIIVIFRLADLDNYNRFDISSDGWYSLSKVRAGESEMVSEFHISPAILTGSGTVNRIRIYAIGDQFRFEVNGTPLRFCLNPDPTVHPVWENDLDPESGCLGGEVTEVWQDADLPRGKIGLGAQAFSGYDGQNPTPAIAVIAFDNLVIWSPDAPGLQP